MAAEAGQVLAVGRAIHMAGIHNFEGTLTDSKGEKYLIRPLLPNDRHWVTRFLETASAPYFRDENPFSPEDAEKRFNECEQRFRNGIPFSMYPIFHETERLKMKDVRFIGYYTIGFDDETGHLHLGAMIQKEYQHRGIMKAAWVWTKLFLREMVKNEVKVNGFPLENAKIRALAHPENYPVVEALEKAGFSFRQVIQAFGGTRRVYEIPVRTLLA